MTKPSLEVQRHLLDVTRRRQFSVLLDFGIVQKAFLDSSTDTRREKFGESLPVVLGSRSNDLLMLFLGLQKIAPDRSGRTKLIQVGIVTQEGAITPSEGFEVQDVERVATLHTELEEIRGASMPNLDIETGVIING